MLLLTQCLENKHDSTVVNLPQIVLTTDTMQKWLSLYCSYAHIFKLALLTLFLRKKKIIVKKLNTKKEQFKGSQFGIGSITITTLLKSCSWVMYRWLVLALTNGCSLHLSAFFLYAFLICLHVGQISPAELVKTSHFELKYLNR